MRLHSPNQLSRRSLLVGAPATLFAAKPNGVRVGAQTNAWPIDPKNIESLFAVLAIVKQLGFQGFETGFANLRGQFDHPLDTADRLKKTGLRFLGIHVFLKTYDPQTGIPSQGLLEQVAEGGQALGAERIIVSGGSTVHPLALRAKADALSKIAKYCKGVGIGCAYHNHAVEFQLSGVQIMGLLNQTDPAVHFVLDAGHAIAGGGNVAEFFARNWRRIDVVHLRDAKGGREVPLGQGDNDFAALAKEIQTAGWKGWLVTEEERTNGDKPGEEAMKPAREAIRRVFGT